MYCSDDINRPGRSWSDARVEAEQKALLAAFLESLEPAVAAAVQAGFAERASPKPARALRRVLDRTWQRLTPSRFPSIQAAVESSVADRSWADMQRS